MAKNNQQFYAKYFPVKQTTSAYFPEKIWQPFLSNPKLLIMVFENHSKVSYCNIPLDCGGDLKGIKDDDKVSL